MSFGAVPTNVTGDAGDAMRVRPLRPEASLVVDDFLQAASPSLQPVPWKPPTLRGDHVLMKPLQPAHADELWPVAQDPGLWDYMAFEVRSISDLRAWVRLRVAAREAETAWPFLIRTSDGKAVGSTSIFDVSPHRTMEVGHTWLALSARRSAVNTECKRLVLGHCFEGLGAIRVQLKCDERNMPSRRAIERLGAVHEGTIRNQMTLPDGHKRNARVYSILDTEWPGVRDRLDGLLAALVRRLLPGDLRPLIPRT